MLTCDQAGKSNVGPEYIVRTYRYVWRGQVKITKMAKLTDSQWYYFQISLFLASGI